ncbi:MAG: cytochrome C biogenesis protein CcmH [Robiginitomaculum sp.]|nr:MAG: cytochrome C biogenesis protein CcmH [Robiginitomaculum sp.]
MKQVWAAILIWLAISVTSALAVTPAEQLRDPALEARARVISKGLRCVVCQNQSIDDSNASLAADMRVLVRQRILAGDTNTQVTQYMVDRYGNFVLLRPPVKRNTYALWFGPLGFIGFGALIFWLTARRRKNPKIAPAGTENPDEKQRIDELLEQYRK